MLRICNICQAIYPATSRLRKCRQCGYQDIQSSRIQEVLPNGTPWRSVSPDISGLDLHYDLPPASLSDLAEAMALEKETRLEDKLWGDVVSSVAAWIEDHGEPEVALLFYSRMLDPNLTGLSRMVTAVLTLDTQNLLSNCAGSKWMRGVCMGELVLAEDVIQPQGELKLYGQTLLFWEQILVPILKDGILDDLERNVLHAAYRLYGLNPDESEPNLIRKICNYDRNQDEWSETKNFYYDLLFKLSDSVTYLTSQEFEKLSKWIVRRAERERLFATRSDTESCPNDLFSALESVTQPESTDLPFFEAQHLAPESVYLISFDEPELIEGKLQPQSLEKLKEMCASLSNNDSDIIQLIKNHTWCGLKLGNPLGDEGFGTSLTTGTKGFLFVPKQEAANKESIWIVGDVHGDILGLMAAIEYITHQGPNATVILLGDLIDRGAYSVQVLSYLNYLYLREDLEVIVLKGNHDEAFKYDEPAQVFSSGVYPADLVEILNILQEQDTKSILEAGKVFDGYVKKLATAIFFEDGLCVTHGGSPHVDLIEKFKGRPMDFWKDPIVMTDMVWNRMHESAPKKRPGRYIKGCEVGYKDFFRFCEFAGKSLSLRVDRMIRGHDHVLKDGARYMTYPKWDHRLVTINNMCYLMDSEYDFEHLPSKARKPVIGKYIPGEMPELHALHIPEEVMNLYLDKIYPKEVNPETNDKSVVP